MSAPNNRRRRVSTIEDVMGARDAIIQETPEIQEKIKEKAMELNTAELQELERRARMAQLQKDRYDNFFNTQYPTDKNMNRLSMATAWYDIKNRKPLNYDWMDEGNSGGFLMKDEKGITRKYDRGSLK